MVSARNHDRREALAAHRLSGWLARLQGDYYSRSKLALERLRAIGAAPEADWLAALTAFHAIRCDATGWKR